MTALARYAPGENFRLARRGWPAGHCLPLAFLKLDSDSLAAIYGHRTLLIQGGLRTFDCLFTLKREMDFFADCTQGGVSVLVLITANRFCEFFNRHFFAVKIENPF